MPNTRAGLDVRNTTPTLVDIALHDHVCALYDSNDEQYATARLFLKVGLNRGERCFYVTEQSTPSEFVATLAAEGVDASRAISDGALQVLSGKELRHRLGGFTPDRMLSFLSQQEKAAKRAGFPVVRWVAEMTWLRADDIRPADFFSFESALNKLIDEHDIVAMCQYTSEYFDAELLIAAAETHPLFVYEQLVCSNYYYIPPEEFLKPGFMDVKWKRMIGNVVTRERLLQSYLRTVDAGGVASGAPQSTR